MPARDFTTPAGVAVTIGMNKPTQLRLRDTCFRADRRPLAGKFIDWMDFFGILNDAEFVPLFLKELDRVIADLPSEHVNQRYFSVTHNRNVGWSSTAPLQDFAPDETEDFAPNGRCMGLRVKEGIQHLAPLTHEVTFSADFMKLADRWSLVVYAVFPGRNIGPRRRSGSRAFNITSSEGLVFFNRDHPGEPLTSTAE